jgi:hypothetical protein
MLGAPQQDCVAVAAVACVSLQFCAQPQLLASQLTPLSLTAAADHCYSRLLLLPPVAAAAVVHGQGALCRSLWVRALAAGWPDGPGGFLERAGSTRVLWSERLVVTVYVQQRSRLCVCVASSRIIK